MASMLPPEPPIPADIELWEIREFRSQLSPAVRDSPAWLLVLTSALVSCHHGPESVIALYNLGIISTLPPSHYEDTNKVTQMNEPEWVAASKLTQRRIQETLVKGSVIFGIPPALDTVFALLSYLRHHEHPLLSSSDFNRASTINQPISSLTTPAHRALDRVYQHNLPDILETKMADNMEDLKFITLEINYGFNLSNETVIDWRETELLVLAALVTQNCRAEVLWHMRGALRAGWSREDVESVREVAVKVARRLGVRTDKVPRLEDVSETSND